MASDKEFVHYVCSKLEDIALITYRPMMGEYLIYVNGVYTLAVADNQVFLKPTKEVEPLLKEVVLEPMYPGAKPSYLINDFEDKAYFEDIVLKTYQVLKEKGNKKK